MHGNIHRPAPSSISALASYRSLIDLSSTFNPAPPAACDAKETFRKAIRQIWDHSAQDKLDLCLDTFLQYVAKNEPELLELLQLTAISCSVVSLTDAALKVADAAYQLANIGKCTDLSFACETLILPNGGKLELYGDLDERSDVQATICLADVDFLPPPSNYRSYRLHADAGPRMRRDCELACAKVQRLPWTIATRGYFLPFQYVIHCRTPFIDSEVSISQRLQLRDGYVSALELAAELGVRSVEVPLISIGGSRSTCDKIKRTTIEAIYAVQNQTGRFDRVCLIGCSQNR